MPKVNVIEFITTVSDGGAETLVKDYALLMDKERFDVTVVVVHDVDDSANWQRLREKGIRVVALSSKNDILKKIWRTIFKPSDVERIPEGAAPQSSVPEKRGVVKKVSAYFRNRFFGKKLLRIIRQTGATVIHAHLDVLGILQAVSKPLKGIRLFHTCHNVPEIVYVEGEYAAAEHLIRENGLRLIALHSDMTRELNEMFHVDNTATIRNGIDMPRFMEPGIDRAAKREEIGIPKDAFVVGHVGRFSEQKNQMFLAEVFKIIAQKRDNACLLMVGAGDSSAAEAKLREYGLQDRYKILHHRRDINELLAVMDVFVFPSIFEGLSVSLVEAQAAGLRCIVSDRCSEEGICTETCIPMPLGDPEKWADAALDPGLKRENSRDLFDYDMNREIRRLEKLYLGQPES